MGRSLSDRYGINVSVESPKWAFPSFDTEDVAVADPKFSATHDNVHCRVIKRHVSKVRFPRPNGRPTDIPGLVQHLAEAANNNALHLPRGRARRQRIRARPHYYATKMQTATSKTRCLSSIANHNPLRKTHDYSSTGICWRKFGEPNWIAHRLL